MFGSMSNFNILTPDFKNTTHDRIQIQATKLSQPFNFIRRQLNAETDLSANLVVSSEPKMEGPMIIVISGTTEDGQINIHHISIG